MIAIMDAIARAMGWILRSLYEATANYGLAIILFTLFIKLITIPLSLKQQRSMKETQEIQPILTKLQEKYKNNQEKLAQEMQKLYEERKINPFGGCLLLLIQFPIIYSMFFAIAQPVKFMYPEIRNDSVNVAIEQYADKGTYKELYYIVNERKDLINTDFLGLDLGQVPSTTNYLTWLIPILSGIATFLSSYISQKQTKKNGTVENEQTKAMQNYMMIFMPLMIAYISFKVPLGMGLYWFVNTVISILLQVWIIHKIYGNEKTKLLDEGGVTDGKNN